MGVAIAGLTQIGEWISIGGSHEEEWIANRCSPCWEMIVFREDERAVF